jgi:hypothetical protein
VAVQPVFVHFHNTQKPCRTLGDFGDQFGCPVKLAIMFFAFQRQQLQIVSQSLQAFVNRHRGLPQRLEAQLT